MRGFQEDSFKFLSLYSRPISPAALIHRESQEAEEPSYIITSEQNGATMDFTFKKRKKTKGDIFLQKVRRTSKQRGQEVVTRRRKGEGWKVQFKMKSGLTEMLTTAWREGGDIAESVEA